MLFSKNLNSGCEVHWWLRESHINYWKLVIKRQDYVEFPCRRIKVTRQLTPSYKINETANKNNLRQMHMKTIKTTPTSLTLCRIQIQLMFSTQGIRLVVFCKRLLDRKTMKLCHNLIPLKIKFKPLSTRKLETTSKLEFSWTKVGSQSSNKTKNSKKKFHKNSEPLEVRKSLRRLKNKIQKWIKVFLTCLKRTK